MVINNSTMLLNVKRDKCFSHENRIFTIDELMNADEIILCSTTKNIVYVFDVDGTPVGGKDRFLAEKLQKLFLDKVFEDTGVKLY